MFLGGVRGLGQAFGLSRAGFLQTGAVSDMWDIVVLGGSMVSYSLSRRYQLQSLLLEGYIGGYS